MPEATVPDLYPSRFAGPPRLIPRHDPVVWDGVEAATGKGPLSVEQLRAFDENGFVYLPGVFTAEEVTAFRAELHRLMHDEEMRKQEQTVFEPSDDTVKSIFEIHSFSPLFRKLCGDERIANVARQILGSDVYIHQSRVNVKMAMRGKGFNWHSDFETWHTEDGMRQPRALSASVALTENNEFNGPLMVVPGSHKTYIGCPGATPDDNYQQSLRSQEVGTPDVESLKKIVDEGGIAAPKGPAGGVVFFDCNIMHASVENLSPYPRSNAFLVYNSVENALQAPFAAEKPRPLFAAAREVVPVGDL